MRQEGIAIGQAIAIDVIVGDVGARKEEGLCLAKRFRADATLRRVPLLAVSEEMSEIDRRALLDAGIDALFTKPVGPTVLAEGIRFLARGRAHGGGSIAPARREGKA